ncbi:hypothetical protein [Photorhabdus tasmaniensis]|uniref:Transcriptional regulator n=1 Tax=Photorhabdus tasmaniensis TaxID=1004159 RepID=A0ABX0GN96_9GAMM|nr:hypothetical protein [Photorhabdus tasmaniensis]NHB89707.1 hypothetical protein [Photorhabdus tasmaniensis]
MEYAKDIKITCKPEALESFWLHCILETGNNEFAQLMGIHPSTSSRDKSRIAKLASQLIAKYGLPAWAYQIPDHKPVVVIEGEHAEMLIKALERKGKIKRKAPSAVTAGVDEARQIEMYSR